MEKVKLMKSKHFREFRGQTKRIHICQLAGNCSIFRLILLHIVMKSMFLNRNVWNYMSHLQTFALLACIEFGVDDVTTFFRRDNLSS